MKDPVTDFARRVKMRALIEDPYVDHRADIGVEIDLTDWVQDVPPEVIEEVVNHERAHPDNLLAQTQQVRRDLRLNIDIAAFQAVYDDLDHE